MLIKKTPNLFKERKTFVSSLFLLLSFLFVACEDEQPEEMPRSNVIVSFVDLTGSIDEETAEGVKNKVEKLFIDLPEKSIFYVYPVDFGANIQPIFSYQDQECVIKRDSDKEKCRKQFADSKKTATEDLKIQLMRYQEKMAHPDNKKLDNSCLINKLITMNNLVKSKYDDKKYKLSLIFFSDMIEDCSESFNNKPISFEKANNFDLIKTQIEKEVTVNRDNANLKLLQIKPIFIHTIRKDSMPFYQLQELWDMVFNKFGYDKGELLKCYWTTELPDENSWK